MTLNGVYYTQHTCIHVHNIDTWSYTKLSSILCPGHPDAAVISHGNDTSSTSRPAHSAAASKTGQRSNEPHISKLVHVKIILCTG